MNIAPVGSWLPENKSIEKDFIKIFGPCSAESEVQMLSVAQSVKELGAHYFRAGIWKPRTRRDSFEGVGQEGLPWLKTVKESIGIPVCTEVATPEHVEMALKSGVDALWIGARTVVSPFSVQAIADSLSGVDIPIFVKNPINPDVDLWFGAIERIVNTTGNEKILAIHRGFSTYHSDPYRNAPMWDIAIELKRRIPLVKIICDASHIAGNRSLIPHVVQSSVNLAFDGLMIEVHNQPDIALSDSKQQLTPKALKKILRNIVWKKLTAENEEFNENVDALRYDIDSIDNELLNLLAQRMDVVREIGRYKKENFVAVLQMDRWKKLFEQRKEEGKSLELSSIFISEIMQCIHNESILQQNGILYSSKEKGE